MTSAKYLLSSLVPEAAQPRPESVAVTCGSESITWGGLAERVAQLSGCLTSLGVARGDRVGIYLHKSIESVVAMHGILASGAAYVPIDPLAPADIVAGIIADCGISVVVSHEPRKAGLQRLPPNCGLTTVIGLDQPVALSDASPIPTISWDAVAAADARSPVAVLEDDLAYVMYTSGSTGRPKGMMHTHRSGMSYVRNTVELYGLNDTDRTANFSPLHFDMSTFELLAGASVGARMVLVPEPHLRFPASLTELLEAQGCTTLQTVPSLFQQMLTRGLLDQRDLSSVRWVVTGGEVFPPAALKELANLLPQARFSNTYGPAEVNQCSYYHFSPSEVGDGNIPIGYPTPNTELMMLDEDDQPVPDGQQGLLLARTANMMAGYWNRPDLDAKAFRLVEGPGGKVDRWYRIGDVVSQDNKGRWWFYGRRDHQVKIRGNRVELEGVEAAVASLDEVELAVVGVRPVDGGDDVLVARYVASSEAETKGWRAALSSQLPPYAVPSVFEPVDGFPLTPSGKIDRRTVRQQIAESSPPADQSQTLP